MRIKYLTYIVLVIAILAAYLFFRKMENEYDSVSTYEECVSAGYPTTATYPEECRMPGKTFTNQAQKKEEDLVEATSTGSKNYKNGTYLIEGVPITLKNGMSQVSTSPSSASSETVRYFGNEVRGDFDGNGAEDIAFLMTKEGGGSGTFYYVSAALLGTDHLYSGTNAIFLGDRIAPQATELKNNEIVVEYADRSPKDPMSAKPHIGVSRYFKIINKTLVEVTE